MYWSYWVTTWMLLATALESAAHGASVSLAAIKDNSIFSDFTSNSSGQGTGLFIGATNAGGIRRALLAFDILGNIPSGATIQSAALTLRINQVGGGDTTARNADLHRLTTNWGEGASGTGTGGGGQGSAAQPGDATWTHAFFSTTAWTTLGGDFAVGVSATAALPATVGSVTWSSNAQLVADVQSWLDTPATNFGWIVLRSDDGLLNPPIGTRRFDSAENSGAGIVTPFLNIEFTPLPEPSSVVLLVIGGGGLVGCRRRLYSRKSV